MSTWKWDCFITFILFFRGQSQSVIDVSHDDDENKEYLWEDLPGPSTVGYPLRSASQSLGYHLRSVSLSPVSYVRNIKDHQLHAQQAIYPVYSLLL